MKRTYFFGIMLSVFFFASFPVWAEQAPQKIVDLAHSELAALGTAPEIVSAVKAQNQKGAWAWQTSRPWTRNGKPPRGLPLLCRY